MVGIQIESICVNILCWKKEEVVILVISVVRHLKQLRWVSVISVTVKLEKCEVKKGSFREINDSSVSDLGINTVLDTHFEQFCCLIATMLSMFKNPN